MINYIWLALIVIGILTALLQGKTDLVTTAAIRDQVLFGAISIQVNHTTRNIKHILGRAIILFE